MSILGWLLDKRSTVIDVSSMTAPAGWLIDLFGGDRSNAGTRVNADSGLKVSAVYRGLSIRSSSLAMLPLEVRQTKGAGSKTAENHWAMELHQNGFSKDHTNYDFIRLMEKNRLWYGNAYAFKEMDEAGRVLSMRPLAPERIRADRLPDGTLFYWVKRKDGSEEPIPADYIFHVHGALSPDGINGYPLIDRMKESIGLALATEEYGGRTFSNGARMGGILKHKGTFSTNEVAKRVRESFEQANSGLSNAGRTALLEEDMDFVKVSMTSDEAQFLESRKFQITDIARWLEVQPHMLGDLDRAIQSNIEQQGAEYVTFTMLPTTIMWEQKLNKSLLRPGEQSKYYWKFDVKILARGDMAARAAYYTNGRQWGWLNADECREMEDLDPLPEGKGQIYLEPVNMQEAGKEPEPAPPQAVQGQQQDPMQKQMKQNEQAKKKKAARALHRVFDSAIAQISNKEANELRSRLKKAAKNSNIVEFSKEIEQIEQENAAFAVKVLTPAVRAWTEITGVKELRAEGALAEYAKENAFTLFVDIDRTQQDKLLIDLSERCDKWQTTQHCTLSAQKLIDKLEGLIDES